MGAPFEYGLTGHGVGSLSVARERGGPVARPGLGREPVQARTAGLLAELPEIPAELRQQVVPGAVRRRGAPRARRRLARRRWPHAGYGDPCPATVWDHDYV